MQWEHWPVRCLLVTLAFIHNCRLSTIYTCWTRLQQTELQLLDHPAHESNEWVADLPALRSLTIQLPTVGGWDGDAAQKWDSFSGEDHAAPRIHVCLRFAVRGCCEAAMILESKVCIQVRHAQQ